MEYVSVLAGCAFSDHPRCTHPLLGWLARRVNDTISDTARPQLGLAAPGLIGTRSRRRGVRAIVYTELARAGTSAAPHNPWLRDFRAIAEYRLARQVSIWELDVIEQRRWQQPLWSVDRNYAFERVMAAMNGVDAAQRDRLLTDVLGASIRRTRRHLGLAGALTGQEHAPPQPHARY